ncbi:MAG: hypothetical protein K2Y40_07200 [Reyranella sp.]|nr:hypothetical protein [Reyranella sp.]
MPFCDPPPPEGYPDVRWYVPPKKPSLARRKRDFLRHLLRWGSMSEAAARTGIDRRTAHRWRAADAAFDHGCRECLERRRHAIRLAAMDRVDNPKTRPVLYRGRQIGHIGRANDRIVAALMWSAEVMGRAK